MLTDEVEVATKDKGVALSHPVVDLGAGDTPKQVQKRRDRAARQSCAIGNVTTVCGTPVSCERAGARMMD